MTVIDRLTRKVLRSQPSRPAFHDNPPPASTRISQAIAERALLDLMTHCRRPGVEIKSIIEGIAIRSANQDLVGSKDIGGELRRIGDTLSSLASEANDIWDGYEITRCEIVDACDAQRGTGAGASSGGGIPQHPSDCEALPPAVVEQIKRRIDREDSRSFYFDRARRGGLSAEKAREVAEQRLVAEHDRDLPHTILGPGGDFTKPLYA